MDEGKMGIEVYPGLRRRFRSNEKAERLEAVDGATAKAPPQDGQRIVATVATNNVSLN